MRLVHDEPDKEPSEEEEIVSRLLHVAGRRPEMPEDLKEAARDAWQAKVRAEAGKRRDRWTGGFLALAALLLSGLGLVFWWSMAGSVDAPTVATVEALFGADHLGAGSTAGDVLTAGAAIETGAGVRAALRLAGGESVRLDSGTRLVLESATVLALERGAVYLDSGSGAGSLAVKTPFGTARDIGTQFEVRLAADGLRVQVREGEVHLELEGETLVAAAGAVVTVGSDAAPLTGDVAGYGPEWSWVLEAAPSFELEGRTAREFLDWVSRETGWQLHFADAALERKTASTIAHGSIAGLTPAEAPHVVLPSSGLSFRLEAGTLVVDRAP